MMTNDYIYAGLDFGTHQTKICIKRVPNEGHGTPNYEFFQFAQDNGEMGYTLPSVVYLNSDRTLSYGFPNPACKNIQESPSISAKDVQKFKVDISGLTEVLYNKYANSSNDPRDKVYLTNMLLLYQKKQAKKLESFKVEVRKKFEAEHANELRTLNDFRYFKQATFADREWDRSFDCKLLSIWYLSYVIFLLEEQFGDAFSINMGIPAGDDDTEKKEKLAVEILCSAYNLVENVYKEKKKFLKATVDELLEETEYIQYDKDLKDRYFIHIFPEAYAGLIYYTSQRKLGSSGIYLTVDIGGGTTDISFFTIKGDIPVIYHYWSINKGLNYLAEVSGFDYSKKDFKKSVKLNVVKDYNQNKKVIVSGLYSILFNKLRDTNISKSAITRAFHTIVYNGGGSMYDSLVENIYPFNECKVVDKEIWDEEQMSNKSQVSKLCKILTTAYGLSMCDENSKVERGDINELLSNVEKKEEKLLVTKECC